VPTSELAVVVSGATDSPPLVLLHGFTQTARCWGEAGVLLGATHRLVAVDAPGHGRSAAVSADLWTGAELLARAVAPHLGEAAAGSSAAWLGYSMGARMALHVALARPDVVERLVLVSGTAGIDQPGERALRRARDDALAAHIEQVGVATFLDEWLALPLFAGLGPANDQRAERLSNTAAGLASSLRSAGTGVQAPLWDRLGELGERRMPTLVVAGARDPKFVGLAERLVAGIGPTATLAVVPEAGHTPHLEQPEAFSGAVLPWLASG
jgi:2-succinyl-6-hydroxy-2,4-cyclohexadiene-1-carboxylate synthase